LTGEDITRLHDLHASRLGLSRSPNPGVGHRDRLAGADEPWQGASARSLPDDRGERGERQLKRALVHRP
jgi:hypothetical protein